MVEKDSRPYESRSRTYKVSYRAGQVIGGLSIAAVFAVSFLLVVWIWP